MNTRVLVVPLLAAGLLAAASPAQALVVGPTVQGESLRVMSGRSVIVADAATHVVTEAA